MNVIKNMTMYIVSVNFDVMCDYLRLLNLLKNQTLQQQKLIDINRQQEFITHMHMKVHFFLR